MLAAACFLLLAGSIGVQIATPLPTYSLLLEGGRATYLDGKDLRVFSPQTRLSVTLNPNQATTRPVFVHARLVQAQNESLWPVAFEQTPLGTLRLSGTVGELLPTCVGQCVLRFYVHAAYLPPGLLAICSHRVLKGLPSVQQLDARVILARD